MQFWMHDFSLLFELTKGRLPPGGPGLQGGENGICTGVRAIAFQSLDPSRLHPGSDCPVQRIWAGRV
jgi:hypothetical protein